MPKFENNILGLIPKTDWLNVGFNVTRQNDPIDGLFGDIRTDNLVAEWETIASEFQIPMMAQFHSFDTEAKTTFRAPVDNHNIEKGLIKVKLNTSERMRALLRNGVQNEELYNYILDDGARLAEQVFTRSKVAKNELMATGQVTINENHINTTVDYGVTAAQKAFQIDLSASGDVPAALETIVEFALDKGVTINGMMTSRKNINKMRKNTILQKEINGSAMQGALVRRSALEAYLSEEFGIDQIVTNDLTYGYDYSFDGDARPVIKTARYYPEDKITFFVTSNGGTLGTGLWGNPPEVDVDQFLHGYAASDLPYVYLSQWSEKDPAVLWTKASALYMPVLYAPESLYIATVTGE